MRRSHSEAKVLPRPKRERDEDQDRAADDWPKQRRRHEPPRQAPNAVGQFGKQERRQAERGPAKRHLRHEPGVERQAPIRRRDRDVVGRVMNVPRSRREVGGKRGVQHGNQRAVLHPADGQDLHGEDRTGDRRPKDRAEPGRHACHQQGPHFVVLQPENAVECAGDAAAHLDGGALSSHRGAEEVGPNCPHENQGNNSRGHSSAGLMDLIDDKVVPSLHRPSEPVVHGSARQSRDWQQVEQPWMVEPRVGHLLECPQEQRASRADGRSHGRQHQHPFDHVTPDRPLL